MGVKTSGLINYYLVSDCVISQHRYVNILFCRQDISTSDSIEIVRLHEQLRNLALLEESVPIKFVTITEV